MEFLLKNKFLVLSLFFIALVGLFTGLFLVQKQTEIRSRAEKTASLSFSPPSSNLDPLEVESGDVFSMDVLLNPGNNLVSTTKVRILYDPAKLEPGTGVPFSWNQDAFTQLVEGPTYLPGEITFTVSIGADPSRAIKTQTRIATMAFHALSFATSNEGPTLVTFGDDSYALALNSTAPTENVINSTIPAIIEIGESDIAPNLPITDSAPLIPTATTTRSITIPTIKCLLSSQLCQPMFVTSTTTNSILKANYKVGTSNLNTLSAQEQEYGSWGNNWGGEWKKNGKRKKWKPNPTPTQPAPQLSANCSSVRVHFYVDGVKKSTSGWLGWSGAPSPYNQLPLETGAVDLGSVSSGVHVLGVQAEGRTSGCNKGVLAAWAGSLMLTTNTAAPVPPPPPTACKDKVATDTIVAVDTSGSMKDKIGSQGTKLQNAKTAANKFVDILSVNTQNKLGLVSFGSTASLKSVLTNNYSSIKSNITALSAVGWTCHECAIKKSSQEITAHGRVGIKKVVVLLTDGRANAIEGKSGNVSTSIAEQKALAAVTSDHNAHQTVYYTIGLGKDVNAAFLKKIANMTGGQYYFSPTSTELNAIYQQISQVLTQGSVTGFVYNDENNNGAYNTNESKLSDWKLQLTSPNVATRTATTDEGGMFSLSGVCGGTYTLKEVLKPGWKQTQPAGGNGHTVTISNGNPQINKNFGNHQAAAPTSTPTPTKKPTPTPTRKLTPTPTKKPTITMQPSPTTKPGKDTLINLDLLLHGIGHGGDNTNPAGFTLSNQAPLHTTQTASVLIYDASNNLLTSTSGTIVFSNTSGSYKGTINLGALPTGAYTIKARTNQHLYRLIIGIQTLTAGQTKSLQSTQIIAGDTNDDNQLNILDYNSIINCYSDLSPAIACNPTLKLKTDLNDDGNVNQVDYNLFLREIATQPGQ